MNSNTLVHEFMNSPVLHTQSGIHLRGTVSGSHKLNALGFFEGLTLSPEFAEEHATIAALGPLREFEHEISSRLYSEQSGIKQDAHIGWYLQLAAGYSQDQQLRDRGSSGGLTTALALELLDSKEIDGLIHFQKSDSDGRFQYSISRSEDEILRGAKTRYFPGSLYSVLDEVRSLEGKFAIVAIPSFVSELRRLCKMDSVLNDRLKYFIGLVCGHQKSANYSKNLIRQFNANSENVVDIDFRYKQPGFPSNNYGTRIEFLSDNKLLEEIRDGRDLFGTNWGLSMFKASFSDYSDDAFNETADVVFGDAWLPKYKMDYRGTNIVIVRNSKIEGILRTMIDKKKISLDPLTTTEVIASQQSLVRHARFERDYRMKYFQKLGLPIPVLRELPAYRVSSTRRLIQRLRYQISSKSHEAYCRSEENNDWNSFRSEMSTLTLMYKMTDKVDREIGNLLKFNEMATKKLKFAR